MWNMKRIRFMVLGAIVLGAIFSSGLAGCSKDDDKTGTGNDGLIPCGDIPPIDASAPESIETATFALG